MLDVLEATKTEYLSGHEFKQLVITVPEKNVTFTHDDISHESLKLMESIEDRRNLTFKGCIASKLVFSIADIIQDLRGEYITATIRAGQTEEIPLFKGYIDAQTNLTHQDVVTEFTCYDKLYKVGSTNMQSWLSTLTFPITVKNFRDSLFNTLGITQDTQMLINDNLTISSALLSFLENPTAIELMQWICQINARYGQIGRDGKFYYRRLKEIYAGTYPGEQTYPSNTIYPGEDNSDIRIFSSNYSQIRYEPFDVARIEKVILVNEEGEVSAQYGSGTNIFAIQDNPIAYCMNNAASMVQAMYGELYRLTYLPVTSYRGVGLPFMECGDVVRVITRKHSVGTYILNRTLTGIQGLFDEYTSDGDQYQPEFSETTATTQSSTKSQLLKNIRQTETLYSEVYDSQGHSKITQNANAISSEVSRAENAERSIIEQTSEAISAKVTLGQSYSGVTIDTNGIRVNTTGALQISAGNFQLDGSGNITCIGGTLGGFQITTNRIMAKESEVSNQNPGIMIRNGAGANVKALAIGYTSYSSYADANFYVNGDGTMHATGAYVKGEIEADSGKLGTLNIGTKGIYDSNTGYLIEAGEGVNYVGNDIYSLQIRGRTVRVTGSLTAEYDFTCDSLYIGQYEISWKAKSTLADSDLVLIAERAI